MSQLIEYNAKSKYAVDACVEQRRIVRVFVTDPDKDVPLDLCVLHNGAEERTDKTDSELFLALGIPEMLNSHNAKRRELELKDIRPRDLRMCVATLVYL